MGDATWFQVSTTFLSKVIHERHVCPGGQTPFYPHTLTLTLNNQKIKKKKKKIKKKKKLKKKKNQTHSKHTPNTQKCTDTPNTLHTHSKHTKMHTHSKHTNTHTLQTHKNAHNLQKVAYLRNGRSHRVVVGTIGKAVPELWGTPRGFRSLRPSYQKLFTKDMFVQVDKPLFTPIP